MGYYLVLQLDTVGGVLTKRKSNIFNCARRLNLAKVNFVV